jgi:two-component system chemotaxis response regulator CheB
MAGAEDQVKEMIHRDLASQADDRRPDGTAVYVCPECGGALWQAHEGWVIRFHCHVGHAWSLDRLMAEKSEQLEAALWRCVRLLVEKATITRQVAAKLREEGRAEAAERVEETTRADEQHIRLIRELLLEVTPNPTSQSLEVEGIAHGDPPAPAAAPRAGES